MNTGVIIKILSNTATVAEKIAVDDWMSLSNGNTAEFNNIKLLFSQSNSAGIETDDFFYTDGLSRIKSLIQSKIKNRKRKKIRWLLSCFCIIAVCISSYFIVKQTLEEKSNNYVRFENASLASVISSIKSKYDIEIEVEQPEILTCAFTGSLFKIESTQEIVESIANALDLQYDVLSDKKYRLKGYDCKNELR